MLPKPPGGYLERSQAESTLGQFVYAGYRDGPVALPKRADPAQVDEFVKKVLESDKLTNRQLSQSGALLGFFDLRPRVERLPRLLDRREREDDEVERSITALALLGDLGNDAQQQQAAEYYKAFVARPVAEPRFARLVDLFFHLPEKADPKWIGDVLDAKRKALEPDIATNVDAEVAYHTLKDLKEGRLTLILDAKKRRHELLGVKDAKRRRQDLARCYLGLEVFPHVRMQQWAALGLQHECNGADPPELADTFSRLLDVFSSTGSIAMADGATLDDDERKACVTSCARALEFYLGQPSEKQTAFVEKNRGPEQNDLLYWEPE